MDYGEFHKLTEATIRGMYDRISANCHEAFEAALDDGELPSRHRGPYGDAGG